MDKHCTITSLPSPPSQTHRYGCTTCTYMPNVSSIYSAQSYSSNWPDITTQPPPPRPAGWRCAPRRHGARPSALTCGALRVITARRRGGWEGTGRVAFLYASSRVPRGPHGHSRQPPCPALSERGNSPAIAAPLPSGPSDRGVSSAPAPRPLFMAPV